MNDQEILEALNKSEAIPPVLCMSERSVTFVEYADGHGEAKTQVNNWFRCPRCNGIVGERNSYIKESSIREQNNFAKSAGRRWNGVRKKASQRN